MSPVTAMVRGLLREIPLRPSGAGNVLRTMNRELQCDRNDLTGPRT